MQQMKLRIQKIVNKNIHLRTNMSKPSVNNTAVKEDNNQLKKENRSSSGNTPNIKDDKRSSDSFASQQQKSNNSAQNQNRAGQTHHGQRSSQQHNDSQSKDRSGNRNDSRNYEKSKPEAKSNEDDKHTADPSAGGPVGEKKFTGRCRLFVGNLTPDITEHDFRKMFEAYGEVSEIYLNPSRGFGFIRLDYRQNAEAAKAGLDGSMRKGRVLRVRFATHGAALKVKNLHPFVSNELLEHSFSQFGELERCVVIVDDRGKSTGEGIVEFVRKPGANSALRRITEGVFLMGMDPKPVFVEPLEHKDEEDGLPEKLLTRNEQYKKEREKEPRFAPPGTFEFEFGMRWKQLDELEKQRIEQVKKDIEDARLKLEDEMQNALFEYQADQIRQELARQQEELRRLEELRNQDRLRRQQEYELRHQQEERERAQQEERRRADAMMMMRQQELARSRGGAPMDIPVLTGREEMMMADRFGDRMQERMPDRMGERMGDRMPDRMGDRMPDRMGDRMPDRMNDRMSSGQSGFIWDDKQREDTNPKPLMQSAGFNMGNTPSGGQGSSAPNMNQGSTAPDPNAMDEDHTEDTSVSKSEDSQETNVSDLPSDDLGKHEACLATFRSPDIQGEHCLQEDHDFQAWRCPERSDANSIHMDNSMHVDLLDANPSSGSVNEAGDVENLTTSSKGKFSPHTCNMSEQSQSEPASELPNDEPASKLFIYSDDCSSTETDTHTMSHSRQCEDNSLSAPEVTCTEFEEVRPCSKVDSDTSHGTNVLPSVHELVKESEDSFKNQMVVNSSNNCLTNTPDTDANCELHHLDSKAVSAVDNQEVNIKQNDLVNNSTDQCPLIVHPQSTTSLQHSPSSPQPGSPSQYSQSLINSGRNQVQHSLSPTGSHSLSNGLLVAGTDAAGESHNIPEASVEESSSHNQNICLSNKEELDEARNCEQPSLVGDKNENSTAGHNEQSLDLVPDSVYSHPDLDFSMKSEYSIENDSEESSYRQHISSSTEEMDTGVLDEDDVAGVTVNSSVYQSYEDGIGPQYEASAAAVALMDMPLVAQYDTTDSEGNHADGVSNMAVLCSSQAVGDDTSSTALVPVQDTATDAATSSTEEATTSISCSSPSLSAHQPLGSTNDQERMFAQGEQAFIAARQAASVPFVPAGCQLSYHPGMNPSMYAGAAMVQGLARPTMMTSSSVHIAQHPGGATIMQHQSMSTGLAGAMSQATVMQQQAMANGVQSTSLLQRTLTNGGQTMVVQQRTMTTGLDGMTQQTMVQQQMAAPGMSPAALFHANAMRQRNMATQQASMMQQRSIRLIQAGVMGNPMLHAQAMRGAGLMPGGQMAPTTLIQHGMLRGVSQGTMMQQLVRQRYLGGPVMPGRGIQLMAGRPIRVKMTYPRESMQMDT